MKHKKIGNAIIWRKSIYDNHFRCQECGCKLAHERTGEPTDNVCVNAEGLEVDNRLFCANCHKKGKWNIVATYKEVPMDEGDTGLLGSWTDKADDYIKEFQKAEEYTKQLKEMTKTLNKKLSEIAEMESMIKILEQRCKNKDAEIRKYSEKLRALTKENEELEHRISEIIEQKMFNEDDGK